MALTSTLFTGLSGLNVNQTRLNVVGNNIANVNTVAFKRSRALFKPQFYVTDLAGSPPSGDFGGTNPSQRGLGAVMATIQKDFSPGSIEPTGKMTDMAIDGEGFFVVQGQQQRYTRDGSFTLNSSNQLVTSTGEFVQGYGADEDGNVIPGVLENIDIPVGAMTIARATENVQMIGNLNAGGNVASGATIVNSQAIQLVGGGTPTALTALTGVESAVTPGGPLFAAGDVLRFTPRRGTGDLAEQTYTVTGSSTVGDLMEFFRMGSGIETDPAIPVPAGVPAPGASLEAITGDPAGSVRLVVVGNSGAANELSFAGNRLLKQDNTAPFAFTDTGTNAAGQTSVAAGESQQTSFPAIDSLGNRVQINLTAVMESKTTQGITWRVYAHSPNDSDMTDAVGPSNRGIAMGTGTLTFDNAGQLVSSTGTTMTVDRAQTGAGTPISMAIDFSRITSLTDTTNSRLQTAYQDGVPIGELTSFAIGDDGSIIGSFTNGLTRTLGQVAVAMFNNPSGLEDLGGNQFAAAANSGLAIITTPRNLGAGAVRSGSLELSNVDLSQEFINMIISTTGFSASSRVITTSDRLITELLNTSR